MVGFAKTFTREIVEHLFFTYGTITYVDLEHNFENMWKAWDPDQPVESLFMQIQDCVDYTEAGGITIGPAHQIIVDYAKISTTWSLMSACRRWNEKEATDKTWTYFKIHFATVNDGYHAANAAVGKTEDQMDEATIGALSNFAKAPASDSGVVATLTQANAWLARQFVECYKEVKEVKVLLKKERAERRGLRPFTPSQENYWWPQG
jgi:hypothetical protein